MPAKQPSERGVSLVETMVAILVAFIAMAGIGVAVFRASVTNKNQGTEQALLTVLGQEKMEELLRLSYGDVSTNTTLISDSGWAKGLTAGGGVAMLPGTDPSTECAAANSQGYVDFLDVNGVPVKGACASALGSAYAYQRRWTIADLWGNPVSTALGTGDGTTVSFSGTITRVPIEPKAVVVTAGTASGSDDGLGSISGTGVATGSVNYTTGAVSVTFAGPPGAGVPVDAVTTTLAGLKQISVVVYAQNAVPGGGQLPSVALTSLKSQ
jgi:hypothetical protein